MVAPEASLVVRGGVLAGAHAGPAGIAALRRKIAELTGDTWRPLRDDSFDVMDSEWHAVVVDRFLAERKGTRLVPFRMRKLDSHEAFVLAVEDGRIVRLFHYVHDPDGFAAFWR